jgi:G3E family GTPase
MTNPPLQKGYEIDTVVTVVDALNVAATVAAHHTAADQIAMADLIVISKLDLATPAQQLAAERCIVALNSQAPRITHAMLDAAPQQLFGMQRFSPAQRQAEISHWLAHHAESSHAHHAHVYTQLVLQHPGPISLAGLTVFLNQAVNTQRDQILRIKGIAGAREKGGKPVIVHAVQNKFYPLQWLSEWPDKDESCRLVFIGRDLDTKKLEERFQALCV